MANNYFYMRLHESFFQRDIIRILKSLPNGHQYVTILLELYCQSLCDEGRLMIGGKIAYTPTTLATVINEDVAVVEQALDLFQKLGLIETLDNGAIYMMNIQNFIGKSTTAADRQRAYDRRIAAERAVPQERGQLAEHKNSDENSRNLTGGTEILCDSKKSVGYIYPKQYQDTDIETDTECYDFYLSNNEPLRLKLL